MFKPALARGELNLIGATTLNEYQKYIEKDAALERRFQPVFVPEPTVAQTIMILRGLRDTLEAHHKVTITDEAVIAAAELSDRYITGRQLPDKAVSLLDTACARVAISQTATPASIEDTRIAISAREGERAALVGDRDLGVGDDERMDEIRRKVDSGRAFGTRVRLMQPAEIKEKFPLIEEELIQGGLWDPDAGLVIPRSQTVAGKLVYAPVGDAHGLPVTDWREVLV